MTREPPPVMCSYCVTLAGRPRGPHRRGGNPHGPASGLAAVTVAQAVTQALAQPALWSDRSKCLSPRQLHGCRTEMWALEQPEQTRRREGCQLQLSWVHPLLRGTAQISLGHLGWERVKEATRVQQGLPRAEAQTQLKVRLPGHPTGSDTALVGQPCSLRHSQEVTQGSNEGVIADEGPGAAGRETLAQPQPRQPPHLHVVWCQVAWRAQNPQHLPGRNWGCRGQTGLWDGAG